MERAFTRSLKVAPINTDEELLAFIKTYKNTIRKSGVRALEDYVCELIRTINPQTLKELLKVLNILVPKIAKDALTQDVYVNIRKAILYRFGKGEMYEKSRTIMKFDINKWRENKAVYMKKVADANASPKEYSFTKIKEVLKNTYDGDYVDKLILLQLCCGSRTGELIYFSTYEETKDNQFIIQHKVLKSKVERDVLKPVLFIDTKTFMKFFNETRKQLVELGITNAITAQAINTTINHRLKKLFDDDDVSTHDMRKLYADMAYQVYAENEKNTAYVSRVLGHDANSVQVSTSYLTVNVKLTANDKKIIKHMDFNKNIVDVPRNENVRDGKGDERLLLTIQAMKNNNQKITARSLQSYGYGARTVREYMKEQKNDLNE
jgi:integrase